MASKSALKRALAKDAQRNGLAIESALNVKRESRDAMRQRKRDAATSAAKFGLSHSLDNPRESPVKWQRISPVTHIKQRFALS